MLENTNKELNKFAKGVIREAKKNLRKHSSSKDLEGSLSHELVINKSSFSLAFYMLDYGRFLDEGVRGAGGTRKSTSKFKSTNNKGKMWKQKGGSSPYRFTNKKPSAKHFKQWARAKGLNEHAIAEAVYRQGIEPTHFFSKAFDKQFKKLADNVVEAFGLDIDDFLEQTLNA